MAYRWLLALALAAACSIGCDDSGAGDPRGDAGVGGEGGSGGFGGSGGTSSVPSCQTSALCGRCPNELLCDTDQDCSVGHVCIESGCDSDEGVPIRQCALAPAGACNGDEDCIAERECVLVPGEGNRCVKTTPGCDTSFDCVLGFACEDGACVDRRVPCFLDVDCPKSHLCYTIAAARFCMRMNTTCEAEFDCAGFAPRCDDVDGDGLDECAGALDPNAVPAEACLNSMCGGATPVCELADDGATSACGQYGLCVDGADCADGFDCVALWPDGRSECVPNGGSCSELGDCPVRQVCASPRSGGPPACQGGVDGSQ